MEREYGLKLTESEWRLLADICQKWLDDHPHGDYGRRRIAHRVADCYAYSGDEKFGQPRSAVPPPSGEVR